MSKEKLEYEEELEEQNEELENLLEEIEGEKIESNEDGQLVYKSVNHKKRAAKFGVLSDGETSKYVNIALEYFGHRCALSGERFEDIEAEEIDRKITSNLSAEHVVPLCQGGHDIVPNIVPTVLQYNISKNGYYLLDWWKHQKDTEGKTIYSPYRLLKLTNFMIKSLQAREYSQGKTTAKKVEQYKEIILTDNEIDNFLKEIEAQDEIEKDNSERKIYSSVITSTTLDENNKKILTQLPDIEANIPSRSEQIRKREQVDSKIMMDIFLMDAVNVLERQLPNETEIHKELNEKLASVVGEIPFEVNVRNIILKKLEEVGIEENKYSVANDLLKNAGLIENIRNENFDEENIEKVISDYIEKTIEKFKKILNENQFKVAVSNIPNILYDENVIKKIEFYKEKRKNHLEDYLFGKNTATDNFIDKIIILQSIGVDTNNLIVIDTIKSLAEKSGITEKQLIDAGLNPKDKIGNSKSSIIQAYRKEKEEKKIGRIPPNQKQVEEMQKLGITLVERDINQEFIDTIKLLQIIGIDTNKLTNADTIRSLAEKSGITEKQLIDAGLNPKDKIGSRRSNIVQAYRNEKEGKRVNNTPPTQEQVNEMQELGIALERSDINQEFIDTIKLLKRIGVNTNDLIVTDTIKSLAEKSGITEEQLISIGLSPEDKIGNRKNQIAQAYRKEKEGKKAKQTPPTQEQVNEMQKLGIALEERDIYQEFIDTIKLLKRIGVDTNKLEQRDTIKSLAEKSGITEEQLIDIGLNPENKVGSRKNNIVQAYRNEKKGKKANYTPPTQDQVEEMQKLGITLEKVERDINQEFIDTIKLLKRIGVDTNKLVKRDTIKSLAEKSGITEKQLIDAGLNPDDKIGSRGICIVNAYRKEKEGKKAKQTPPTQEQVEEMQELGITLEKVERDINQEFIDTIKLLQIIGIDTNKLTNADTISSLAEKSGIMEKQLIEVGLSPEDRIGSRRANIVKAYRNETEGKRANQTPPTQEQVEEMQKLGITLEKVERDINQEFIDTVKLLKRIGVNTNDLIVTDTIKSLAEKSGITEEQLISIGLIPEDKIGNRKSQIAQAYRKEKEGKNAKQTPPTQEQVEEMQELGITLEERDINQEFIDTIKLLQIIGVDTKKLVKRDTIKSLAEKSGITEKQLIDAGLNPEDKIGSRGICIVNAYRKEKEGKKANYTPPTQEQVEEMQKLGITLEKIGKRELNQIIVGQKEKILLGENVEVEKEFEETIKNAERNLVKSEQER